MRTLKVILLIMASLLGLLLILGLVGPSREQVTRSATVHAPIQLIYGYVSDLSEIQQWSPWKDGEKGQKRAADGEHGASGAVWQWEGGAMWKGRQEILELKPEESVVTKLTFSEPLELVSISRYELEALGDSTRVTWEMEVEHGFLERMSAAFRDLDALIGPRFEIGLASLKKISEEQAEADRTDLASRTIRGYVIEQVQQPELVFIGKRSVVKWKDMEAYWETAIGAAQEALVTAHISPSGQASAVYFNWDERLQRADYLPGFRVDVPVNIQLPGMDTHVVPPSTMLRATLVGGYSKLKEVHEVMYELISNKGLTHYGNVVEEYAVAPASEPDSMKWVTHVYYMIR